MKIFRGLRMFGGSSEPNIRETDRMWLEKQFMKLIKAYGYPEAGQLVISESFFPYTFRDSEVRIDNIITDCLNLLGLEGEEVEYEIFADVVDSENLRLGSDGQPRLSFIDFDKARGVFLLELSEEVLSHPVRTILTVCFEMCRAKLLQGGEWVENWEDSDLLTFLAAIHFGFGVIIAPNLTESGRLSEDFFQSEWTIHLGFPLTFTAYAFGIYAWISRDRDPVWKRALHPMVRKEFSKSINSLQNQPEDLFEESRLEMAATQEIRLKEAEKMYQVGRYEEACMIMEGLVEFPDFIGDKSLVFNNLGYYKMRLRNFEAAILDLHEAIDLDPTFGYAYDNLGLCYILVGDLKRGKYFLDKAQASGTNDPAYSLRNLAIYYQKMGKMESAKDCFHEAFAKDTPVDLLDFYYGEFLINYGELEKGKRYIRMSAQAGEREGLELLRKMEGR